MHPIAIVVAALAGLIHAWFFILESLIFERPSVSARFGLAGPAQVEAVRPWARNQGFYNLVLAVGVGAGLLLVAAGQAPAGRAIVLFACASMLAAGVVLATTSRRFLQAASIQAIPPLVALVASLLG